MLAVSAQRSISIGFEETFPPLKYLLSHLHFHLQDPSRDGYVSMCVSTVFAAYSSPGPILQRKMYRQALSAQLCPCGTEQTLSRSSNV